MLAVGARQTLAPVLDIARDPRWGRSEETYGEDPYLASRLGVAYVRGVQGDDLRRGVAATGKHFLGYGFSEGGLNHAPVHLGARELREVYARPFEAAIREAGLASMMNAYNEVDGLPCAGAAAILDDLLRGELGFDGVVVADYYAVVLLHTFHHVAADKGAAARMALAAGLDVELPQLDCYGAPLRDDVESGAVPMALVDRSVRRLLRLKFALGLFEQPYVDAGAARARLSDRRAARPGAPHRPAVDRPAARTTASCCRSDPRLERLAVIGPCADDVRLLQGDYSYPAHLEIIYKHAARHQRRRRPTSCRPPRRSRSIPARTSCRWSRRSPASAPRVSPEHHGGVRQGLRDRRRRHQRHRRGGRGGAPRRRRRGRASAASRA